MRLERPAATPCRIQWHKPQRHTCSVEHRACVEGYHAWRQQHLDEVENEATGYAAETRDALRRDGLVTFKAWLTGMRERVS